MTVTKNIDFILLFVRDGILSVADYDSTLMDVVVVIDVVIVVFEPFSQWDNSRTL